MKIPLLGLLVLLSLSSCASAKKRYDGYQVFQLDVLTDEHIQMVRTMHENVELDFWSDTDVMVPPHLRAGIISMLNDAHLSFTVINENVQDGLDAEERRLAQRKDNLAYDLNDFNTYSQILEAIDDFVANCPLGVTCTKESMGKSYEGRDVPALTITSNANNPVIYLDSLIHCREWLAGATVLKIADRLINQNDDETVDMRTSYNWYIAPVINPDGYLYTWSNERFWRKNREPNGGLCIGTDLNRNFDANWMYSGTSTNPCSDLYGGPSAGSAIETQNVQNKLKELGSDLHAVITYHAYARMWLHAYGYTTNPGGSVCARSSFYNEINAVSKAAADAVEATGGQSWVYGPVCTVIYPASGSTVDYCHDVVGAIYAFTPELRGSSFDAPASEIVPSYEEQWAGMVAMAREIENQASKRQ